MSNLSTRLFLSVAIVGAVSVLAAGCDKASIVSAGTTATTAGTDLDDTVVTTKVKSALLADADVRSFELGVETRKGVVQLSGFVDSQAQMARAIASAKAVEGVKSVTNALALKVGEKTAGSVLDDTVITTRVKTGLLGDPGIRSFELGVETRKGEVQLSGFVDSQAQIDRAVSIAGAVTGVTHVDNGLSLKK